MPLAFTYAASPAQIDFGPGASRRLPAWVERLGWRRVLVLSTPRKGDAEALAAGLGTRTAGVFAGAAMHTPVAVTEAGVAAARAAGADGLVAIGGGSAIGLGKAIALRTGLPQVAIPTTYAGSEATDILGETADGVKTTIRDPQVRPGTVLYDPDLTLGLPVATSIASGLNAMSHAAEALYATDRNPVTSLLAAEGFGALHRALPRIVADPGDRDAREDALYGAWLCGTVLGSVAMALHHKLCHTLGGSFGLPHAETHAVLLPHTVGFNAAAVPELLAPLTGILGGSAGGRLFDFAKRLGAPTALSGLGMAEADLDRAARLAAAMPYPNPRPIDEGAIRNLLGAAWRGDRPAG